MHRSALTQLFLVMALGIACLLLSSSAIIDGPNGECKTHTEGTPATDWHCDTGSTCSDEPCEVYERVTLLATLSTCFCAGHAGPTACCALWWVENSDGDEAPQFSGECKSFSFPTCPGSVSSFCDSIPIPVPVEAPPEREATCTTTV